MSDDISLSYLFKDHQLLTRVDFTCPNCRRHFGLVLEPGDPATGSKLAAVERKYFRAIAIAMLDAIIDSMEPLETYSPFAQTAKERLKLMRDFMMED